MKIMWTNKWSKEQGYVKCINKNAGYFENTFSADEAKKFNAKNITSALRQLEKYEPNNVYSIVE